jgi:hypothetical protein
MASTIKAIPIIKDKQAKVFEATVKINAKNKGTLDFSTQLAITSKIMAKAKI